MACRTPSTLLRGMVRKTPRCARGSLSSRQHWMWDPPWPCSAGGHAGSALHREIRARPGNGRCYGPGPGPRSGCRIAQSPSCESTSPRSARCWTAMTRHRRPLRLLPPTGIPSALAPWASRARRPPGLADLPDGSGVPGRARPADASTRGRGRGRRAAQLGHARSHYHQPKPGSTKASSAATTLGPKRQSRSPCTSGSASMTTWPQRGRPSACRCSATPWATPASPSALTTEGCSPRWGSMRNCVNWRHGGDWGEGLAPTRGRRAGQDAARGRLLRPRCGGARAAFARLSSGPDEAIVRVITARPGLEPVRQAMAALAPSLIRAA